MCTSRMAASASAVPSFLDPDATARVATWLDEQVSLVGWKENRKDLLIGLKGERLRHLRHFFSLPSFLLSYLIVYLSQKPKNSWDTKREKVVSSMNLSPQQQRVSPSEPTLRVCVRVSLSSSTSSLSTRFSSCIYDCLFTRLGAIRHRKRKQRMTRSSSQPHERVQDTRRECVI